MPWPADEDRADCRPGPAQGNSVGRLLMRALKRSRTPKLLPRFETSVQRLKREQEVGASRVEIAFDQGRVTSGGRSRDLCEVEFELKEGEAAAAVEVAREWRDRHGLWLGTVSKAEKGMRLASGSVFGPAVTACDADFPRKAGVREVAVKVLDSCLEQMLGNASELAAGSNGEEHIHQLAGRHSAVAYGIARTRRRPEDGSGRAMGGTPDPGFQGARPPSGLSLRRRRPGAPG